MRRITLVMFIICFLPLFCAASNHCVSNERMAIYKLMMNKSNILTFVSHPKAWECFLKETQRKQDYMLSLKPEIQQLQQQFYSDACVEQFCQRFQREIDIIMKPLPYEDTVMPFLACGIADLSGVETQEQIKLQEFQIKLFKNYFDRQVRNSTTDCTSELEEFSRCSSLPLFSRLIHPLLHGTLERGYGISDLTDFYWNHATEVELSDEQAEVLEDVFNPQRFKFKIDSSKINFSYDDDQIEEFEQGLYKLMYPCGEVKCAGREAIEALLKKYEEQHFFSTDWLMQVFVEVLDDSGVCH